LINIPIRQKILIMLAAMSAMLLAALDQTIVSTALPRIVNELHGLNELSWVVTAYLLTSTISVPIAGKLSDIYGRKKMFLIGIFIFVVGSMLSGLSQNMSELILFRAIQGIGAGTLMSNVFSVVGDLFAPAERARWQGFTRRCFWLGFRNRAACRRLFDRPRIMALEFLYKRARWHFSFLHDQHVYAAY
jgi:MFS family permease